MKDATLLMSEESSPTACLIAPLHAKLIQDMKENTDETPVIRFIKRVISEDLSRRYTTVQETSLHKCASLDLRFKGLSFLSEEKREEAYKTVIIEASSLQGQEDWAKEQENPEDCTVTEANSSVSPQRIRMTVLLLQQEELHLCFTVCWDIPSLMLQLHHIIISQPVP